VRTVKVVFWINVSESSVLSWTNGREMMVVDGHEMMVVDIVFQFKI